MAGVTEPLDFPVYVPTRGRPQKQMTADALLELGISPYLVVEAAEEEAYSKANPNCKVIVWPQSYLDDYEKTPELDPHPTTGAAHNYAWDHSRANGYTHHWIMDDNIGRFLIRSKGRRANLHNPIALHWHENLIRKYQNLAGIALAMAPFMMGKELMLNTRLYCCTLYRNDLNQSGIKWRRGLNDDTIVSLDILKTGYWCTAESRVVGIRKTGTSRKSRMSGGMTDFYAQGGFIKKSAELVRTHPDCSRTVVKFNRVHHVVDFSGFKQQLIPVDQTNVPPPKIESKSIKTNQKVTQVCESLQIGIDLANQLSTNPQSKVSYPIYIPSKGRAQTITTAKLLNGLSYYIVVEPQEAKDYAKYQPKAKLLILSESNKGIAYVRNFIKQHAADNENEYHWQLDDDIRSFSLRYNNRNNPHNACEVLSLAESVTSLYFNVEAATLMSDAYAFASTDSIKLNKFVKGAMLLKNNDLRFNANTIEDLDMSLQILAKDKCTLQFTNALVKTVVTKNDTGGNGVEWRTNPEPWNTLTKRWTFLTQTIDKHDMIGIKPVRLQKYFKQQPILKDVS